MFQFFLGFCMFVGMMAAFTAGGIIVAVGFTWLGDKAFDCIAAGQTWQQKKGWW